MTQEIAVIDDECDIADIVKLALEQAGYRAVTLCQNISDAFRFIKEQKPQLVLLDVRMPQVSGWTLLEQIRNDPETSQTPVVLTTGMPEDMVEATHALKKGETELLMKPFDLDDLVSEVERMIGKP
ncbi:MAG: response regulator [Chloroflexi bacterium]|nr:response regulator [Chloroflexota bacterium]